MGGSLPWYCDACGQPIKRVEHGYVQWLDPEDGEPDMRIVHGPASSPWDDNRCLNGHPWADLALAEFLDGNGLLRLLYFVEKFAPSGKLDAVTEVIRRLHVQDYEQVRGSLSAAATSGVFEKAEHITESNIAAVLAWKNKAHPK